MENVIRRIFTSVVIPPNFIHFQPKISFKSVLGNFTSLSGLGLVVGISPIDYSRVLGLLGVKFVGVFLSLSAGI